MCQSASPAGDVRALRDTLLEQLDHFICAALEGPELGDLHGIHHHRVGLLRLLSERKRPLGFALAGGEVAGAPVEADEAGQTVPQSKSGWPSSLPSCTHRSMATSATVRSAALNAASNSFRCAQ